MKGTVLATTSNVTNNGKYIDVHVELTAILVLMILKYSLLF